MTQYDWHLFNDEINKPKSDENAYCFTVNYPSCYGCPVIKYELDGKELMFLVDTGYTSTFLTKEGLKCFFIDEQEMLQTFLDDYYLKKWNMKHEGNDYSDVLKESGLVLSGMSPDGRLSEIVELPDLDWFVACQFHPEFKSRPERPHPLFKGLIDAVVNKKGL